MSAPRVRAPRPEALSWWGPGVTTGPRCSKAVAEACGWLAYWQARAKWSSDAAEAVAEAQRLAKEGHAISPLYPLESAEGRAYLLWSTCQPGAEDYADRFPQFFTDTVGAAK